MRKIAEQIGLPNAAKKDSTGICFIGERPFREFLNRYLSFKPGPMKTPEGDIVGEHVGLSFYTLGQRKGIGIGGMKSHKNAAGDSDPWYVARKDVEANTLYVVQGHDHPWLLAPASRPARPAGSPARLPPQGALSAKTRYRQADVACDFRTAGDGRLRAFLPRAAMGRDPRPVGGAVPGRGLPGRRHHHSVIHGKAASLFPPYAL